MKNLLLVFLILFFADVLALVDRLGCVFPDFPALGANTFTFCTPIAGTQCKNTCANRFLHRPLKLTRLISIPISYLLICTA